MKMLYFRICFFISSQLTLLDCAEEWNTKSVCVCVRARALQEVFEQEGIMRISEYPLRIHLRN
jgi:hypothetical protein